MGVERPTDSPEYLIFKACVKPHLNYCTPVWACCRGEQTAIDKLLLRAKQTVINSKNTIILKSDFRHFGIVTFTDLSLLSVACQFFDCIHNSSHFFNTFLLTDFNASCDTRASHSNNAYILKSKSSCDNCFYYHTSQLWNTSPNSVTCQLDFKIFYASLTRFIFSCLILISSQFWQFL